MEESKFQKNHPNGNYELEVLDHAFVSPKIAPGEPPKKPYLTVKVQVNKLLKANDPADARKPIVPFAHRYVNLYFTPDALQYSKDFLEDAGFRGTDLRSLDKQASEAVNIAFVSLKGYKFEGYNKTEVYNGEKRDKFMVSKNNSKNWMSKLERPNQGALLGLNALWGASAGLPGNKPTQPSATQPEASNAQEKDDFDWNS